MNFSGIIVGAATFLIIGICHPIENRVLMGGFPENPARHDYYERIRKSGH